MALPSAQAVADKWSSRTSAASADYVAGAQATDKDPTALAIAALPRAKANYIASVDSGRMAARLRAAGRQGWLNGIQTKGASNFQNGVAAAKDKVATAFAALLAYEEAGLRTVQAMPNVSDADREARAIAWIRYMRQYQAP